MSMFLEKPWGGRRDFSLAMIKRLEENFIGLL